MPWLMIRPSTSCGPPAANGITITMGWFGKFCATAAPPGAPASVSSAPKAAPESFLSI